MLIRRADLYVAAGFASAVGASVALAGVLFVTLDAFQNLDDLAELVGREGFFAGTGIALRYYTASLLVEAAAFGEVLALAGALMAVATMAKGNEFVALLSGGMSLRRVALPIFIGCGVLGVAVFALRNAAGPQLVRSRWRDLRAITGSGVGLGKSLSVQGWCGEDGASAVALSLEEYDPAARAGKGFSAAIVASGRPFVDIRAKSAQWDGRAKAWRFPEGAHRWSYQSGDDAGSALAVIRELHTRLGPDLLEAEDYGPGVLTLGGLYRQRARPEFAAAFHERLAQLVAPLALALAALPFVLLTDRARVFPGAMLAIAVTVGYELTARVGIGAAASGYLPAVLGGWVAPVGFGAFGAWRLAQIDT
jgi:lipopolysaccharide export LptBFGC system permease protein LptF